MKYPDITKEILHKLYIDKELSALKIAKKFKANQKTILRYLKIYKIPVRKGRNMKGKNNPFFGKTHSQDTIDKIKQANTLEPNKCIDCGKILKERRSTRCIQCFKKDRKKNKSYCKTCGKELSKNYSIQCKICIEKYYNTILTKEVLIDLYEIQEIKAEDIATKFNMNIKTILQYLKKYKISVRHYRDTKGEKNPMYGRRGELAPNWIDGRSFIPYTLDFNDALKEKIRKRDNYTCLGCGMTEEEHLVIFGTNLHCHHVDHNKNNCLEENLATTCNYCNNRANFNRDYWKEFYTNKIAEIINVTK